MLIQLFMFIFAIIIFYIGYYLYTHRSTDFMLFKPSTNKLLSQSLNVVGKILIGISIITLLLGITGNTVLILIALVLGIFSTTGTLLFLLKFL
ncbi:hypothetical protein GBO89_02895 [Pediococcus pentosaceus]|jgi:hypothetical protein|uniref:DUF3784 domain-containing protein n=3 Tax=Pediococcus pentosaceus TaxID=1255 RepID=A0A1Y0VRS6_PEDPE|nr:hypothetical protein PEPE_1299 [Pediococcus pentosaceus ATCC 25745]AHA05379.1 hypothetical protein T256_06410 [Pediococcus pentosaceus SL4]ANI97640.1 hypothetical protein AN278_003705 [Pediococcus pentosaceus]ARW19363.1 hypothetical protein S100892_00776 [Pediococcus pentosaceus]ASC08149.1 hypothetical protein S100194_00596 [Pediococcus pentosaceus]